MGSYDEVYRGLKNILAHSVNFSRDEYPRTIQLEYKLLMNSVPEVRRFDRIFNSRSQGRGRVQVSFAQGRGQ